jgi:hypothetical protein
MKLIQNNINKIKVDYLENTVSLLKYLLKQNSL